MKESKKLSVKMDGARHNVNNYQALFGVTIPVEDNINKEPNPKLTQGDRGGK